MITMRLVLCLIFLFISLSVCAENETNPHKTTSPTDTKKVEKAGIPLNLVKDEIKKCTNNANSVLIAECDPNEIALSYNRKLIVIGFTEKDMKFYQENKKLSPQAISQIKSATNNLVGISSDKQKEFIASNIRVDDEDGI